jgi:D-alanyl-D-alanine carboxypeptidase
VRAVVFAGAIGYLALTACGTGDDSGTPDRAASSTTSIEPNSPTTSLPTAPTTPAPTTVPEPSAPEPTDPDSAQMAPARVAALQAILDAHDTGDQFVGAVVTVRDASGATATLTAGAPTLTDGAVVDPTVAWNIGSVTKTFLAVVVLQLADEGRIDLDTGIDPWLPSLADAADITPRQLLQHTSGLGEYLDAPDLDMTRAWNPLDLVAVAEQRGRVGAPGEKHAYSNTNYLVLGEIVERVTGNSWHAEVASRLAEPLGLTSIRPVESGDQAPAHSLGAAGWVEVTDLTDPSIGGAAGGLQSTASDLLVFTDALAEGELLPAELHEQMETFVAGQDYSQFGVEHRYGLGVESYDTVEGAFTSEVSVIGHMGVGAGQSAFIGFDRSNGTSVAVQFNADIPGPQAILALELLTALAD